MTFSRPKGTNDVFGDDIREWQALEEIIRAHCGCFLVSEIRTPMYEYAELFTRGVGETTDIVQKEMFTFTDQGGRLFALRPESTANTARAYIENGLSALPSPLKLFYISQNFRAEKPQKGRYRQHTQFGIEYYGAESPECDAEVISVASELLNKIGIKDVPAHINSLGCGDCRVRFNESLAAFLSSKCAELCATCGERLVKNPLRTLDCKNPQCAALLKEAPTTLSVLCGDCVGHFSGLKSSLDVLGVKYTEDTSLVRGLDYYTRTVFEFISPDLGAQSTVCGGGRYDNLIKDVGGPKTPAIGFGMGLDRLLMILGSLGIKLSKTERGPLFAGYFGEAGKSLAAKLALDLRRLGVPAQLELPGRSVKAQMKYADKIGAAYAVIIGDEEVKTGVVKVRDMGSGEVWEGPLDDVAGFVLRGDGVV